MARVSKIKLSDKDIIKLKPKAKRYLRVVGEPKELYICVNPSKLKSFTLRHNENFYKIRDFRLKIFGVKEARIKANLLLRELENELVINRKITFGKLFEAYLKTAENKMLSENYIKKLNERMQKHILPRFKNVDIKNIKFSDLKNALMTILKLNDSKMPRLETIFRLIGILNKCFEMAVKDRYILNNPCRFLKDEFVTPSDYARKKGLDNRMPSLTEKGQIRGFLQDLKASKISLKIKNAIYLQILTANRPFNTASLKWSYVDFKNKSIKYPPSVMKMSVAHEVALNSYALKILNEMLELKNGDFVFASESKSGHITIDAICKAIRNLGFKDKYKGLATTHGFRATFRTICSLNLSELNKLGISEKTIENTLAHKEGNAVKYAYERARASLEQSQVLMQWYGDFLNDIEPLF